MPRFTYPAWQLRELRHAMPFRALLASGTELIDGLNYIGLRQKVTGEWPAFATGYAIYNRGDPVRSLIVEATIKADRDDASFHVLFAEPYKGDYDNYLGFRYDAPTKKLERRTRSGGVETLSSADSPDVTEWHTYKIRYQTDKVYFFVDGVQLAAHTTNISSPPHEWMCCEPAGTIITLLLKLPYLRIV